MPPISATRFLEDLTDPQREAVLQTEGPLLILAAAGSGKTRVITRRIAYLIASGVPAWQILALTFTNKAAGEMRERVHALLHEEGDFIARGLTVSTFHSLCARLLRRYAPLMEGKPRWRIRGDYTIYDTDDQLSLMKQTVKDMQLSTSNWEPRMLLSTISSAKNQLKDAKTYAAEASDFFARTLAKVFEAYEKALHAANAVDFDDLLMLTVRVLQECDEAREEVQQRWRYLMIDEYQDTNHVQYVLSTLLCGKDESAAAPNVCVVGDPDQSIYGWRGADISNILEFEEQYPGARVIALGQNFRSTAPILAIADHLIRNNVRRKHKDLFTSRRGGNRPEIVLCRDEHHESALIADWLRKHHESGAETGDDPRESAPGDSLAWKDIAVFYRNNALSRVMEDQLRREGIPYVIARGTAFYQREEVKDAIAYLRVVANPSDEVSLRRIINKPARKIGKVALEAVDAHARRNEISLFDALRQASAVSDISPQAANAIDRFVAMIDGWTGGGSFLGTEVSGSLSELVSRVLTDSGLESHYKKAAARKSEEESQKLENLRELVSSASDFEQGFDPSADAALGPDPQSLASGKAFDDDEAPPLLAMLRAYLESVSLVADADAVDPASGAVTLMTLHAAKGLEFPAVAIIGLEEGLLPAQRALSEDSELEEERRLCFVGITRAMNHLLMTSAKYRTHRGLRERTIASRFLSELPSDQIVLSDQTDEWDSVHDDPWGDPQGSRSPAQRLNDARRHAGESGGTASEAREFSYVNDDLPGYSQGLKVGVLVRHPQFGVGRVASIEPKGMNPRATIEFRDAGKKTLVLQYARLSVVGDGSD